jgi:hypothetical protein
LTVFSAEHRVFWFRQDAEEKEYQMWAKVYRGSGFAQSQNIEKYFVAWPRQVRKEAPAPEFLRSNQKKGRKVFWRIP